MLLFVPFMEKVKIRGIQFVANSTDAKASAPAKVKVFVGGANLDFDGAASTPATQAVGNPPLSLCTFFAHFTPRHSLVFIDWFGSVDAECSADGRT